MPNWIELLVLLHVKITILQHGHLPNLLQVTVNTCSTNFVAGVRKLFRRHDDPDENQLKCDCQQIYKQKSSLGLQPIDALGSRSGIEPEVEMAGATSSVGVRNYHREGKKKHAHTTMGGGVLGQKKYTE